MTTFAQMVDEVSGYLRAYSSDQEAKSYLLAPVDTTAVQMVVADPDRLTSGMVEVDEELVEVSTIDAVTGTMTIFPWGRGQQGTQAAAHDVNARVTVTPRWPRSRIKRTINEIISGVWPDLFAVATFETPGRSDLLTEYGVPADVRRILSLRWDEPVYGWQPIVGWRLNQNTNTTNFPTGTTLEITESVWPGHTIRGVYATEPRGLVNDADDYAATTGLPDGSADLICIGAAARLVAAADLAAVQVFTVEHAQRIDGRGVGSGAAASRYLMQLYQTRLIAERNRLLEQYPIRQRRTW